MSRLNSRQVVETYSSNFGLHSLKKRCLESAAAQETGVVVGQIACRKGVEEAASVRIRIEKRKH